MTKLESFCNIVLNNWLYHRGFCAKCPARYGGPKRKTKWANFPVFGIYYKEFNGKIMVILEEPGPTEDIPFEDIIASQKATEKSHKLFMKRLRKVMGAIKSKNLSNNNNKKPTEYFYFAESNSIKEARYLLQHAGVNPDTVYYTNIIKCRNPLKPFEHCAQYLISEIAVVNPQIILTFGSEAFYAMITYCYWKQTIDNTFKFTFQKPLKRITNSDKLQITKYHSTLVTLTNNLVSCHWGIFLHPSNAARNIKTILEHTPEQLQEFLPYVKTLNQNGQKNRKEIYDISVIKSIKKLLAYHK